MTRELKRTIQTYEQEKQNWVPLGQKRQEEGLKLWTTLNEAKAKAAKAKQEVVEAKQREPHL